MEVGLETLVANPTTQSRLLLLSENHLNEDLQCLRSAGYTVESHPLLCPIANHVRTIIRSFDIVLVDLTHGNHNTLKALTKLQAAIGICSARPRLLCFSNVHRNPHFVMAIEKSGARYVRITDPAILLEATQLLLAEMNELERNGPTFRIVHRFSQGSCAPGEEVAAVLLWQNGNCHHLPLGIVERLVFELLAQRRRVALDSLQIVSAMSGDWFFREHAANSGHKQIKRVRRANVKVIIQRIRDAMTSIFAKAHLGFDGRDVLRSCSAEGTNRVLYKLHADVRWHHELR